MTELETLAMRIESITDPTYLYVRADSSDAVIHLGTADMLQELVSEWRQMKAAKATLRQELMELDGMLKK